MRRSSEAEVQTPLGVKLEAATLLIAEKKKSSISGEAKNAIGDFLDDENVMATLLFLGAGGHVETSEFLKKLVPCILCVGTLLNPNVKGSSPKQLHKV
ncbi:unnamed protein product [Sphenostylis stenocarpa]|uniref:Uncharacterized protein n=1 Tax=Sphenostylis stenocarpa TaxID=92480 RepID=A0AA86VTE7_9FABA|nr:unnamed protein product [Sphenostylis stenocarpa]